MNIVSTSKAIFVYFFEKVYQRNCPAELICSTANSKAFEGFSDRLVSKDVAPSFIYDYTLFQFGRYIQKIETNTFKSGTTITPLMVYGKKPHVDVYDKRNPDMEFMLARSPLILYGCSKQNCQEETGIIFTQKIKLPANYQDPIKTIASSGSNAFDTCVEMTDLYSAFDKGCQRCLDAQKCKEYKERKKL